MTIDRIHRISITLEELGYGTPQAQLAIKSTLRLTTGLQHTIRLDQDRHLKEHAEGLVLGVEHTSRSQADIATQEQWFLDINPNGKIPFAKGTLVWKAAFPYRCKGGLHLYPTPSVHCTKKSASNIHLNPA